MEAIHEDIVHISETNSMMDSPTSSVKSASTTAVPRGRRRSSVMIEYYRDNYMNCKDKMGEISEQHLQDIKDTFNLLDRNKDGKLSKGELETLLRYNGSLISDQEIDELLEPIDTNHNGAIDYDSFEKYVIEKDLLKKLPDELCYEMMEAFNTFDKNGDGFIDREELKVVLTQVGDKMPDDDADDFIKAADLNGDGKIDYIEFCKHMGF